VTDAAAVLAGTAGTRVTSAGVRAHDLPGAGAHR